MPLTPKELRSRRLALGMDVEQLARHLGVSPALLTAWERGETAIGKCDGLCTTLERLEGRTGGPPEEQSTSPLPTG